MIRKASVCISLSQDTLSRIDRERGLASRSAYVEHKLRECSSQKEWSGAPVERSA